MKEVRRKAARGGADPPAGARPGGAGSPDRKERVDRIRRRCDEGTYAVPSEKVADRIVRGAVSRIRRKAK